MNISKTETDTLCVWPTDILQPSKDKLQKEKENKGLFGMFKRGSKKKLERVGVAVLQYDMMSDLNTTKKLLVILTLLSTVG